MTNALQIPTNIQITFLILDNRKVEGERKHYTGILSSVIKTEIAL